MPTLPDDRPDNLRPVTTSQRRMSSQGKLGRDLPKGVSEQNKKCNRPFYARIKLGVKRHYVGSFETVEEAEAAYDAAAKNLFGEYARPNNYQAGRQVRRLRLIGQETNHVGARMWSSSAGQDALRGHDIPHR